MAGTIRVTQAYNFGTLTWQTGSNTYVVQCTPDPATGVYPTQGAVVGAVQGAIPGGLVGALIGTTGYILPFDDLKIEHICDALYMAEVSYKYPSNKDRIPDAAGPVLGFSTSGGTQHINQSKGTTKFAASGTAPDFKGAIGFDGQHVHGVDIGIGVYRFSEEWTLPAAAVTPSYRRTVKALTFTVNTGTFRGFDPGEVLFEGAEGRRVKGDNYSVTFNFAVSRNATNIAVGDITVSAKTGWQYLWVFHKDAVDQGFVVRQPAAAYVETVYDSADFSGLSIGVGEI